MRSLEFASYCRLIGTKGEHRLYAWCVFVDPKDDDFCAIREVEYTLHPSFPNPVRVIDDYTNCFALQSEGWDEFQLVIRTTFNDGHVGKGSFHLRLRDHEWPLGGPIAETADVISRKVYNALTDEKWEWLRISTLARKALISVDETRARLDALEKIRTVRRAHFLSLDREELWGATSRVGLLPKPK